MIEVCMLFSIMLCAMHYYPNELLPPLCLYMSRSIYIYMHISRFHRYVAQFVRAAFGRTSSSRSLHGIYSRDLLRQTNLIGLLLYPLHARFGFRGLRYQVH